MMDLCNNKVDFWVWGQIERCYSTEIGEHRNTSPQNQGETLRLKRDLSLLVVYKMPEEQNHATHEMDKKITTQVYMFFLVRSFLLLKPWMLKCQRCIQSQVLHWVLEAVISLEFCPQVTLMKLDKRNFFICSLSIKSLIFNKQVWLLPWPLIATVY